MKNYQEYVNTALTECSLALNAIPEAKTNLLIDKILAADKVFFVGVGRVFLSLQSFAKRLAHLGINAHLVGEITEPAITDKDLLIAASGSGETLFPKEIAKKAKAFGAEVVMIGSNKESTLANTADLLVRVPTNTKLSLPDEIQSTQIMTSLFEQSLLLYGDVIASMIAQRKELDVKKLWRFHANLE